MGGGGGQQILKHTQKTICKTGSHHTRPGQLFTGMAFAGVQANMPTTPKRRRIYFRFWRITVRIKMTPDKNNGKPPNLYHHFLMPIPLLPFLRSLVGGIFGGSQISHAKQVTKIVWNIPKRTFHVKCEWSWRIHRVSSPTTFSYFQPINGISYRKMKRFTVICETKMEHFVLLRHPTPVSDTSLVRCGSMQTSNGDMCEDFVLRPSDKDVPKPTCFFARLLCILLSSGMRPTPLQWLSDALFTLFHDYVFFVYKLFIFDELESFVSTFSNKNFRSLFAETNHFPLFNFVLHW